MVNSEFEPMHDAQAQVLEHMCGAKTRSGGSCKNHPVTGKKRCRMHGGAKGSGGQQGNRNAMTHGLFTREARRHRLDIQELLRLMKKLSNSCKEKS